MQVVVIGAGIIGVTTAYFLRQQGAEVTVIERQPGVAQEASFANGGVMAPAYAGPWAQPGMPRALLAHLLRSDGPLVLRPGLDAASWRWLHRWWGECDPQRFRRNKERMQRLALYSRTVLHSLRERHAIDYEQAQGYLQLLRTDEDVARTAPARALLAEAGIPHHLVSADEARRIEPALVGGTPLAAAVHLPDDETGNCAYFARRLREIAEAEGVRFRFGTQARRLHVSRQRVDQLETSDGPLAADVFVVAAGADSARLLGPVSIDLPLLAIKGYSATALITRHDHAPLVSVMDEHYKVTITRLGNRLRIAGTAEVSSGALRVRPAAARTLLRVAGDWFPAAAQYKNAQFWVGARPMLPDGPPVLGATLLENLFLNVGHGSSGWLMACGSARVVTDVITGRTPDIDLDGLTVARYRLGRAA
jgi:D-amino-acid dehydrogenase